MKINQSTVPFTNIEKAVQVEKRSEPNLNKRDGMNSPTFNSAEVDISDRAVDMARARSIVESMSDVRPDRIAMLKKQIADGTYWVDAEKIADRIVDEHLATDFGKNNL